MALLHRDLLLALHNVPQQYDEAAIKGVLNELTPQHVRIMWSSKLFQVSHDARVKLSFSGLVLWSINQYKVTCQYQVSFQQN